MAKPKTIETVLEQDVVFNGQRPEFVDPSILIYTLNHYAYASMDKAREDGCDDPHRFRVRITIDYEVLE